MSPNSRKLTKVPPPNLGSYSMKRHASFDSPAEIPLPTPTPGSAGPTSLTQFPFPEVPGNANINSNSSSSSSNSNGNSSNSSSDSDASSMFACSDRSSHSPPNSPDKQTAPESSASLPLPSHVPFKSLPRKNDDETIIARMTNAIVVPASSLRARFSAPPRTSSSPAEHPNTSRFSLPARHPPAPTNSSAHARNSPYPTPDPPTIVDVNGHTICPVSTATLHDNDHHPTSPPYSTFLSPLPPPKGVHIECQTHPSAYILYVHLPGFKRDAITLAIKKQKILHVVADSWADDTEPSQCSSSDDDHDGHQQQHESGGHFERRIAFGYDADLAQVRAEFDGQVLKIHIPRKPPHQCRTRWSS